MTEKKIITVTDLGRGDGGKGGKVHALSKFSRAHTIVKSGGAQGSHGVRTAAGESFNFSQFGCGTFEGVRTHITPNFVMMPIGLINEARLLRYAHHIPNAYELITVDRDTLCSTPYHRVASRLRELARKGNRRGTVGTGVGEACNDSLVYPDLAMYARDLSDKVRLQEILEANRVHQLTMLTEIIGNVGALPPEDQELAKEQIETLHDEKFVPWLVEEFFKLSQNVRIVDGEYFAKDILAPDGVVVVETSHGILTDRFYGFTPHTSKLRTLLARTTSLLENAHYTGEVINLGLTRAYAITHGAGPFVTDQPSMVETLLPGSSKNNNRYQGDVRVGPLDMVTLRYAIDVCGGPGVFHGLLISWFDQIQKNGSWQICESYQHPHAPEFFSPEGDILVRRGEDQTQLDRQSQLTQLLYQCRPNVVTHATPSVELCAEIMKGSLQIPVRMVSVGPTEDDKVCL